MDSQKVVSDEETPMTAVKNSKNTSMWNCVQHQLEGKSDISLSAGNTSVLLILSKMILKFPSILGCSIPEKMEPTLLWLQKRLDLNDQELSKMVLRLPSILGLSIPDKMEPTLLWLQNRLCLSEDVSLMLQKQPSFLGNNVQSNLEPTFEFYEKCIGTEATIQLIRLDPSLFTLSLEKRL